MKEKNFNPVKATPIIFVHGLGDTGGAFYYLWEKFAAQGFPVNKMSAILLPRVSTSIDPNGGNTKYGWYTMLSSKPYNRENWLAAGNTVHNKEALKNDIDRLIKVTGAGKVDLVGHSNGTFIIRELLMDPVYAAKVRKAVFISGLADVSGSHDVNIPPRYYQDISSNLPATVEYYAISSEGELDFSGSIWGTPNNNLPFPYKNRMTYFNTNPGYIPSATNHNVPLMDHRRINANDETFSTIYQWLIGKVPKQNPTKPSAANIGGRIVLIEDPGPDITVKYKQAGLKTGGTVKVYYYDPNTGAETEMAGSSIIDTNIGSYLIEKLDPSKYLKIVISANGATSVYFLADKIQYHNLALDFLAPEVLPSDNEKGKVSIDITSLYSFLSRDAYTVTDADTGKQYTRPADTYSGNIMAPGCVDFHQTSDAICCGDPRAYSFVRLQNFGSSNVAIPTNASTWFGGNVWRFDENNPTNYDGKIITITHNLNGVGDKKAQISGDDRQANISNYILYLYRL